MSKIKPIIGLLMIGVPTAAAVVYMVKAVGLLTFLIVFSAILGVAAWMGLASYLIRSGWCSDDMSLVPI